MEKSKVAVVILKAQNDIFNLKTTSTLYQLSSKLMTIEFTQDDHCTSIKICLYCKEIDFTD